MKRPKECSKNLILTLAFIILSIGFVAIGRNNEVKAAAVGDTVIDEKYPHYTFKVINADTYEVALVGAVANNTNNYIIPGMITDNAGKQYKVISIEGFNFPGGAKSIEIGENISIIGEDVFRNLSNLESIKFPGSLTKISEYAFYSSGTNKSDFIIDLSNTRVESIDEKAFWCSKITELKLPVESNTLKTIGNSAFAYCMRLSGRLVIPGSVEVIGDYAFQNDVSLSVIDISYVSNPELKTVGKEAFYNCHMKGYLSIGNTVEKIGEYAFAYNEFDSLTINNNGNILGNKAFFSSRPPKNIAYMGPEISISQFSSIWGYERDGSSNIQVDKFSTGEYSRNGYQRGYNETEDGFVYYIKDDYCEIVGVNKAMLPCTIPSKIDNYTVKSVGGFCNTPISGQLTIPDTVEIINDFAFSKCDIRGELIIPSSIKEIKSYAFSGCANLRSVTISDNLQSIMDGAFLGCKGLEKLVIPESVENIRYNAFYDTGIIKEIVNESNCELRVNLPEAPYYYYDSDNRIRTTLIDGSFKIKCDITNNPQLTVDIKDIDNLIFKGTRIEPEVTIKNQDVILQKNVDYVIKYDNSDTIVPGHINIVANHRYVITGIGNYAGKISGEF